MPIDPHPDALDAAVHRLAALRPQPGEIRVPPIAALPEVHGRVWRPVPAGVRFAAGAATAGAVAAGVALLVSTLPTTDRPDDQPVLATGPNGGVVPVVSVVDGAATTELTLADGSVLELTYPAGVDLADTGFLANPAFAWPVRDPDVTTGDGCCGRGLQLLHEARAEVVDGLTPAASYPGADGREVLWFESLPSLGGHEVIEGGYLLFEFGDWTAAVWTGPPASDPPAAATMSDEERRTWAASVRGETTADGYVVVTPAAPLAWTAAAAPDGQFGDVVLGMFVRECGPDGVTELDTQTRICFSDEGVELSIPAQPRPDLGLDPDTLDVDVITEGPLFDLAG